MHEATIPTHIERWIVENVYWADPLFADVGPGDDEPATSDKETERWPMNW